MKIALISASKSSLEEISRMLESHSHSVIAIQGGKGNVRIAAEQEQPQLIVVDGLFCDAADLDQVEYVTTRHPDIAVILLCATLSPEFLLNAMRVGVREVLAVPVAAPALEAALRRVEVKRAGTQGKSEGKILAFMSCKGGSGATFLATNLGYQLAESSRILLIDLNLQFGDALSFVHDGSPASTLAHVVRDIRRLDASFLAASTVHIANNYSILAAPDDPAQALEVKPEHLEAILNLAVKQYDFVLLDLGRTIDPLTIKALDHAHRIFPVLQAELPYLRNAKKLLEAFNALGYPPAKTELIVNRFSARGAISMEDIERLLGRQHLHTVPNSYKDVSASINHGHPLIKTARSNAVSRILTTFALTLAPKQKEAPGLLGRFFGRA